MASQLKLVKTAELKGELSKEQKRFNSFLLRIKTLKQQIEDSRDIALELSQLAQKQIKPVEEQMLGAWKTLIVHLDKSYFVANLTPKQYQKYETIMFEQADSFLAFGKVEKEVKAIFDKYSEESYDEIQAEHEEMGKDYIIQVMKMQFGVDIEEDDIEDVKDPFNNPKLMEKISEAAEKHKADHEAQAQEKAEKEAQSPKSDKQIKSEEKRKAAESAVSKTTKQIYMDLVKNFHPDTEQDEEKRLWKTEIMQQITVAYDEDDYIKLLELQMTLLEDREHAFGKLDNKQLRYFNDALKQQVEELSVQLEMASPAMNPMFPYTELFSLNREEMKRNVNQYVKDCKSDKKIYDNTIGVIQTQAGFKQYVKQYQIESHMNMDMGLLIDMMRHMR